MALIKVSERSIESMHQRIQKLEQELERVKVELANANKYGGFAVKRAEEAEKREAVLVKALEEYLKQCHNCDGVGFITRQVSIIHEDLRVVCPVCVWARAALKEASDGTL